MLRLASALALAVAAHPVWAQAHNVSVHETVIDSPVADIQVRLVATVFLTGRARTPTAAHRQHTQLQHARRTPATHIARAHIARSGATVFAVSTPWSRPARSTLVPRQLC